MSLVWLTICFNWFMISYMVNTLEKIYESAIAMSIADILSYLVAGLIYKSIGIKRLLLYTNMLAAMGGLSILYYGLQHESSWTYPLLIFIAKTGVSCAFNGIFIGHQALFPVLFATTSFGICNIFGRMFSALSPLIANIEQPIPMQAYTISSAIICILVYFLYEDVVDAK